MMVVRRKPGPYEMAELQEASKRLSEAWTGLEGCVERLSKKFGQGVWTLFDYPIGNAREAAGAMDEAVREFDREGVDVEVPDGVKPASREVLDVVENMRALLPDLDELLGQVVECGSALNNAPEDGVDWDALSSLVHAGDAIGSGIDDFENALRRFEKVHGLTEKEDGRD